MAAQNSYDICSSYPIQFGIPSQFNTGKLSSLAKTRVAGRVPMLSWFVFAVTSFHHFYTRFVCF